MNSYFFQNKIGEELGPDDYAQSFSEGYAVIQVKGEDGYRYLDTKGNLSQEFEDANSYSNGYAMCALDTDEEGYRFRDLDGELSEEFYNASDYIDGFACVKLECGDDWCYRDERGQLSEFYNDVECYEDGFGEVIINNQKFYRDMVGNVTKEQTDSGKVFYKFWKGEISVEDIPEVYYEDVKFFKGVISVNATKLKHETSLSYLINGEVPPIEDIKEQMDQVKKVACLKRQNAMENKKRKEEIEAELKGRKVEVLDYLDNYINDLGKEA